jgi:vesicle-associated membrane protein 7
MVQNIDKVLERGEKIELLVDKTDRLQGEASRFRGQAKKLKNAMWWKNAKMMALIGLVIALVLYFLVALICGASFQKCAHHHDDSNN